MKLLAFFVSQNRRLVRFFTKEFRLNTEFEVLIENYASKSEKILEIGGSNRPLLKLTNNYLIVGCDIDNTKDYTNCYNEFHLGEINTLPHRDFDLVYSSYLMEHVVDVKCK